MADRRVRLQQSGDKDVFPTTDTCVRKRLKKTDKNLRYLSDLIVVVLARIDVISSLPASVEKGRLMDNAANFLDVQNDLVRHSFGMGIDEDSKTKIVKGHIQACEHKLNDYSGSKCPCPDNCYCKLCGLCKRSW